MSVALSGDRMVDCLLYGVPSDQTRQYFQKEISQLQGHLNHENHWAINALNNVYHNTYSQEAVNNAQWCLRNSISQFREDIIHKVEYEHYRPNLITQQYIMACPDVWDMRVKGLSNDFNMTYIDQEPHIKDIYWRDDYIKVMNGYLDYDKSQNGYYTHYYTEDLEELELEDQLVILSNWEIVRNLIANHEDPTIIK